MRPRIWFQFVPERKEAKNRVHLDIDVTLRLSLPFAQRREGRHRAGRSRGQ